MNSSTEQIEAFIALVRDTEQFRRKCIGVEEYESKFVEVLEFVKARPNLRPKIVEEFVKLLQDRTYGPYEIIVFCMYDLKWPEVLSKAVDIQATFTKEVIQRKLHGTPSQHLSHLEEVISSFSDEWKDKDLFKYYNK